MQTPSYKNEFDLHENQPVGGRGTFSYEGFSTKTCSVRGIVQLGTGLFITRPLTSCSPCDIKRC